MKRFIFLTLSLVLLLMVIPGCITVQPPAASQTEQPSVIGSFTSSPSAINSGGSSTLSWNVTGANSVSIDQGIGQVNAAGTMVVSPVTSTIYTISATNSAGTINQSSVTTVINSSIPTSFAVTSIVANTDPTTFVGVCPKTITFYATITANGPGTVTYIWESIDGQYAENSAIQSVTFSEAGAKTTISQWDMIESAAGWHRVHVLTPNDTASNPVYYTLNCD